MLWLSTSPQQRIPVIVEYVPRRVIASNNNKYTFNMSQDTVSQVAGSTLPLVNIRSKEDENCDYDPFQNRKLTHPTTDSETLIHLLKGTVLKIDWAKLDWIL